MAMTIISLIIITLLLVLLGWTWHNLGSIEKTKKIALIIGGIIVVYVITLIIYNISKIGIVYENKEIMRTIQNVFVSLFTIVNGCIILPYTFKRIELINNDEMSKEQLQKSIIILVIIIVALGIFESLYLGNIQQGILNMIRK